MHSSLRSTQLLMWSSPILLVVLVFTLTSSSSPTTNKKISTIPTTLLTATSTTNQVTATTTHTPTSTISTTSTTFPTKPVFVPIVSRSSSVTSSTVKSDETVPNVNVPSVVVAGKLTAALGVVDVPLIGPGSWRLTTTGSTRQTLNCAGQTIPLTTQVVVGVNQSCQLDITATAAGTSIAWQLTPSP